MTASNRSTPKCLIVDDEIGPNESDREEFLHLIGLSAEDTIFADNYEKALSLIRSRNDLVFCFLDCRIPQNHQPCNYEFNVNDPDFVEWGLRLIPEINFPIFVFSAFVPISYLKQEEKSHDNIIGYSEKPFNEPIFFELRKQQLEKLFNIEGSTIEAPELKSFDYNSLDSEVSIFVREKTREIKRLTKKAARDIIDIGTYLIEIKEKLGHGNFYNWLEAEFSWGKTTAYNFMRVAKKFKSSNFEDLNFLPSALYELSSVSTPESAINEAIERAKKGEVISDKTAKAIKMRYQNKKGKKTSKNKNESSINSRNNQQQISESKEKDLSIVSPSQSPGSLFKTTEQSKQQILTVQKNTVRNSFWKLNLHNRLFSGEPSSPIFSAQLPERIATTINYIPQHLKASIPLIKQAESSLTFESKYDDDFNLQNIISMVENWLLTNTSDGDLVVFCYLYQPQLLDLAVNLGCDFYLAEPDLAKCEQILDLWRQKSSVSRLQL